MLKYICLQKHLRSWPWSKSRPIMWTGCLCPYCVCFKESTTIPGDLPAKDVPQMITVSPRITRLIGWKIAWVYWGKRKILHFWKKICFSRIGESKINLYMYIHSRKYYLLHMSRLLPPPHYHVSPYVNRRVNRDWN